jgi:hypothetical protein
MSFQRRIGNQRRVEFRDPKRFFFIAMEGKETEPRYFDEFKTARDAKIQVKLVPNPKHKSRPKEVLQRLHRYMRNNTTLPGDEGWLVIDRNSWPQDELDEVCRDAEACAYSVAVSNPCFELWLFLHLRENRPFIDRHECQKRLAEVLPGYSPSIKSDFDVATLLKGVEDAIRRGQALDTATTQPWPKSQCTRVYLLVSKLRHTNNGVGG